MEGKVDAVIGEAILGKVVGADSLVSVAGTDLAAAGFGPFGIVGAPTAGGGDDLHGAGEADPGEHDAARMQLLDTPAVSTYVTLLHPRSRGTIALRSANPADDPVIRYPMFDDPRDLADLIAGARRVREIFEQSPMRDHVRSEAIPGPRVQSDAEWADFLRRSAWGAYHMSGTCAMGTDADAVVDPELRVRGVDGLRVVDASVMPEVTGGNTNAPVIMIAEKASDLVLGRTPLA